LSEPRFLLISASLNERWLSVAETNVLILHATNTGQVTLTKVVIVADIRIVVVHSSAVSRVRVVLRATRFLDIGNEKIFSLVVFVGDSKFKTKMPENVTYGGGAVSYIRSKNKIIMSYEQISQAKGIIMGNMLERGFKTDREHTKHVKTIVENKT